MIQTRSTITANIKDRTYGLENYKATGMVYKTPNASIRLFLQTRCSPLNRFAGDQYPSVQPVEVTMCESIEHDKASE
jgi:hypothetical protein